MYAERTFLDGVLIFSPRRHRDERGFFSEVFRRDLLEREGVLEDWNQDNHSMSRDRGVVRGLHFQAPPVAQAKLLRVISGAILDVAVDIRKASPTFGRHLAVELSAENWKQLYIPAGFAHGFCTLAPSTQVVYKVSGRYSPEHEGGLAWNDPALGIPWPILDADATLSSRDRSWPLLRDFVSPF